MKIHVSLFPRFRFSVLPAALIAGGICSLTLWHSVYAGAEAEKTAPKAKPALNVQVVQAQSGAWQRGLAANGNISAWQEIVISAEIGGQRLAQILVNVGDPVKKGQVLARFASESIAADLAQAQAALEEAQAALDEAQANAQRAASLSQSGALSAQQITQYQTAEKSAKARVNSAKARLASEQLRLRQTQVLALEDGVVSARTATLGAVAQQGQELFKMVRDNRLEWRAEVNGQELGQIKNGMRATLQLPDGKQLEGKVRSLSPTLDPASRNALVYVDLPAGTGARAGMYASGRIELGASTALSVPQTAVVIRDGYGYVFVPDKDARVKQVKVSLGRRLGDKIEVLQGIDGQTRLVAQGAGFLSDGDQVQIVSAPATTTPAPTTKK